MKSIINTKKYIEKNILECEMELSKLKRYNYPEELKYKKINIIEKKLLLIEYKKTILFARTTIVNIFISNEIKLIRKNKVLYEEYFKKTERKFKILSWILYLSALGLIQKYYLDNLAFNFHIINEIKTIHGMSKFDSLYGTLLIICFLGFYSWCFLRLANIFFSIKISILLMKIFLNFKYKRTIFININFFKKLLMSFLFLNLFVFIPYLVILISILNYIYK